MPASGNVFRGLPNTSPPFETGREKGVRTLFKNTYSIGERLIEKSPDPFFTPVCVLAKEFQAWRAWLAGGPIPRTLRLRRKIVSLLELMMLAKAARAALD